MAEKALEAGPCSGHYWQRSVAEAVGGSLRGGQPVLVSRFLYGHLKSRRRDGLCLHLLLCVPVAHVSATFPLCHCSLALDVAGHWGRPRPQEMSG